LTSLHIYTLLQTAGRAVAKLVISIEEVQKTVRTIMKYNPKKINPSLTTRTG